MIKDLLKLAVLIALADYAKCAPTLHDCVDPCGVGELKLPSDFNYNKPGNWSEHNSYDIKDGKGKVEEEYGQFEDGVTRVRYFKSNTTYSSNSRDHSNNHERDHLPVQTVIHSRDHLSEHSRDHLSEQSRDRSHHHSRDHNLNQYRDNSENDSIQRATDFSQGIVRENSRHQSENFGVRGLTDNYRHDEAQQRQTSDHSSSNSKDLESVYGSNYQNVQRTNSQAVNEYKRHEEHHREESSSTRSVQSNSQKHSTHETLHRIPIQRHYDHRQQSSHEQQYIVNEARNTNVGEAIDNNFHSSFRTPSGQFVIGAIDLGGGKVDCTEDHQHELHHNNNRHTRQKKEATTERLIDLKKEPTDAQFQQQDQDFFQQSRDFDQSQDVQMQDAVRNIYNYDSRYGMNHNYDRQQQGQTSSSSQSNSGNWYPRYHVKYNNNPTEKDSSKVDSPLEFGNQDGITKSIPESTTTIKPYVENVSVDDMMSVDLPLLTETYGSEEVQRYIDEIMKRLNDTLYSQYDVLNQEDTKHSTERTPNSDPYLGLTGVIPKTQKYETTHSNMEQSTLAAQDVNNQQNHSNKDFDQNVGIQRDNLDQQNNFQPNLNENIGNHHVSRPLQNEETTLQNTYNYNEQQKMEGLNGTPEIYSSDPSTNQKKEDNEKQGEGKDMSSTNYNTDTTQMNPMHHNYHHHHHFNHHRHYNNQPYTPNNGRFGYHVRPPYVYNQRSEYPSQIFGYGHNPFFNQHIKYEQLIPIPKDWNVDKLDSFNQFSEDYNQQMKKYKDSLYKSNTNTDKTLSDDEIETPNYYSQQLPPYKPHQPFMQDYEQDSNGHLNFGNQQSNQQLFNLHRQNQGIETIIANFEDDPSKYPIKKNDNVELLIPILDRDFNSNQQSLLNIGDKLATSNTNPVKTERYGDISLTTEHYSPVFTATKDEKLSENDNQHSQQIELNKEDYITEVPRYLNINSPNYNENRNHQRVNIQNMNSEVYPNSSPQMNSQTIDRYYDQTMDVLANSEPHEFRNEQFDLNTNNRQNPTQQTTNENPIVDPTHSPEIRSQLAELFRNQFISSYNRNRYNYGNDQASESQTVKPLPEAVDESSDFLNGRNINSQEPNNQRGTHFHDSHDIYIDNQNTESNYQQKLLNQNQNNNHKHISTDSVDKHDAANENIETISTSKSEVDLKPRILEAYGGGNRHNRSRDFSNAKVNPSATLSPLTDGLDPWIIDEKPTDADEHQVPAILNRKDVAAFVTETTTEPPKSPGFWSRIGHKITNTYDKAKEKARNIFG